MEKMRMESKDLCKYNIDVLEELFPGTVIETIDKDTGKKKKEIDPGQFKAHFGIEYDDEPEHYEFVWPGKKKAKVDAYATIRKTLRPDVASSKNFDETRNIYIRGDNFNALKILQESYLEKIKVIYIDPPYNTGSDLVYKDDFALDEEEYRKLAGQLGQNNERFKKNTEAEGRYHSFWCSMIYCRLLLARNLLRKDGAIFISIDDNELNHLLCICDEIFGNANHVATIPWRKRTAKSDVPFGVSQDYEWIVVYAKSDQFVASVKGAERKYYTTPDIPNDSWRVHDLTKQTTAAERPNSFFTIVNPKTGEEYPANPNATWRITKETFDDYYKENRIVFPGDYDFLKIKKPVLRYFKSEDMKKAGDSFGNVAVSTKLPDGIGMSQDGTKEITDLFGGKVFSFPKPSELIKFLVQISTKADKEDIVMDFFSGSATTAQAVMDLNQSDGGNRSFILVQYPEDITDESNPYKTICDLGIARIDKAGDKIKSKLGGDSVDVGFRVFDICDTIMKDVYYSPSQIRQANLDGLVDNIKEDCLKNPLFILYAVILDWGLELSLSVESVKSIPEHKVFSVDSGTLVACFDSKIDEKTIEAIAKMNPTYAVFRDGSFENSSSKINLGEVFKSISPDTVVKVI
ncbi:site-specific DNA-methyltransferase [Methanomethylophilus alvi]|uniref:site-specific DNA-methyltransferase n=1 Tax=Methanomethylophilus alvi TaxID=1291540 RepID=UPI0037DCA974